MDGRLQRTHIFLLWFWAVWFVQTKFQIQIYGSQIVMNTYFRCMVSGCRFRPAEEHPGVRVTEDQGGDGVPQEPEGEDTIISPVMQAYSNHLMGQNA